MAFGGTGQLGRTRNSRIYEYGRNQEHQEHEISQGDGLVKKRIVIRKGCAFRCVMLLLCTEVDARIFHSFSLLMSGSLF